MRNRNFYGEDLQYYIDRRQKGRRMFGIMIAVFGVLVMLKLMGIFPFYMVRMGWPVILILVGLFGAIKNGFRRHIWWLVLILVGIANLVPEFMLFGRPSSDYLWPVVLIVGGIYMAFRPKRNCYPDGAGGASYSEIVTSENTVDIDVVFGGKKEMVTSKDLQGGTVTVTFAGCELNLSQADFTAPSIVLDFKVAFGGVEIVVPSHWEVKNEISSSFGAVEDERTFIQQPGQDARKLLILRGSCSFGSIEIKSY